MREHGLTGGTKHATKRIAAERRGEMMAYGLDRMLASAGGYAGEDELKKR